MNRNLLIAALPWFLLANSTNAAACSPPPRQQMTMEEQRAERERLDRLFVEGARSAKAIVEVRAVTTTGVNFSRGDMLVVKVLHGKARRGRIIRLVTVGSSLCGAGNFSKGERGVIIIDSDYPNAFGGFLTDSQLAILRADGVIS